MDPIVVRGIKSSSRIFVGEDIANVAGLIGRGDVYIITDDRVQALHGGKFPPYPVYAVKSGEQSKSLGGLTPIYEWLLNSGASRSSFILGIGGGVVCDIAGFIASTYMRGVAFGFVATTLLAQVDASVGGKNGMNLNGYKNIVGTFNQPQLVICETSMLPALPKDELVNGFAEMVKHAIIADPQQFAFIEENVDGLTSCDVELLTQLVRKSVLIKAAVVEADEHEGGLRKTLNLGHTWGHAVEKISGLSHGKCVSIGLVFAAKLSQAMGLLPNSDYLRIRNLLCSLQLPVTTSINPQQILEELTKDKKRCGNAVDFVLIRSIGAVEVQRVDFDKLRSFVSEMYLNC